MLRVGKGDMGDGGSVAMSNNCPFLEKIFRHKNLLAKFLVEK